MGSIGPLELVLILVIVLLIFGGRKIPELARGLGEGIRHFRESLRGGDQEDKKDRTP
jgi:sec-independent protein translocase protein TatA